MVFTAIVYSSWEVTPLYEDWHGIRTITMSQRVTWDATESVAIFPDNSARLVEFKILCYERVLRLKRIMVTHTDTGVANNGVIGIQAVSGSTLGMQLFPFCTAAAQQYYDVETDILVAMKGRSLGAYSIAYLYWAVAPTNTTTSTVTLYFEVVN